MTFAEWMTGTGIGTSLVLLAGVAIVVWLLATDRTPRA